MKTRTLSFFRHFKIFGLHAILHDAAGAVRAHSGKGPSDCYMIGREPNFCVLGQVTRPLVCFYVKLFLPYIFNYFDFWSRMSLIVLDKELTEKNIIKELGLFIDGPPQGYWYSFCPPTTFKPNEQTTRNTSHTYAIAWSSGKLDYDKLFAVFCDTKVTNAEVSAKGLEKCRLLTGLMRQNVEKLDDYGCPKIQDLVKTDSSWMWSSYPFQHKTRLHCAKRKAKVYGEWAMQHL